MRERIVEYNIRWTTNSTGKIDTLIYCLKIILLINNHNNELIYTHAETGMNETGQTTTITAVEIQMTWCEEERESKKFIILFRVFNFYRSEEKEFVKPRTRYFNSTRSSHEEEWTTQAKKI